MSLYCINCSTIPVTYRPTINPAENDSDCNKFVIFGVHPSVVTYVQYVALSTGYSEFSLAPTMPLDRCNRGGKSTGEEYQPRYK